MKTTNTNRFKQILSLLMVMAVGAGSMIIAPRFNAVTNDDTQADTVQSVNADEGTVSNTAFSDTSDPAVEIVNVRSDTQGIPVGETQDVIFSAEIRGDVGMNDRDVSLLDNEDHLIGYMYDDGENGDEAANDGVFTLKTALSSDEEKYVRYRPNAMGVDGDSVMIGYYTPASDEAIAQMNETDDDISSLVNGESYQQKTDEEKVAAAGELLEQLEEDGMIMSDSVAYDEDIMQYTFKYNTTALGLIQIKEPDETTDDLAATSAAFTDQLPSNAEMTDSSSALAATGSSGSTRRVLILNAFGDSRRSYYQSLVSDWNAKGLLTTEDTYVTIGDMKSISSTYDVVNIAMHGNVTRDYYGTQWDPILGINQDVTSSSKSTYSYELNTRHSVGIINGNHYVIFPKLFADSYSSSGLSGKLICANACCFYGCDSVTTTPNYNMSNALRTVGASAVYGYHNSVKSTYSRDMIKYVVEQCFNGVGLTTAVNNAKRVYGNDDNWEDPSDDKYKAYPIVNPSGSSFVLRSGSITPATESISLNSSKTATISSGGSMKYYKITPSATTQVTFYSTGSYDTYGYIYNASMSQLASNDDGGSDHNFRITYTLSANTTYILGCKFFSSTRTGSFTVRLESAYESISLNSSKTASINTGGSMKYYTYTSSVTTQVQFYSTGSYDTYGYIYNANMSQLASNDDGGSDHNFRITYTLSANTTYILGCRFYSSSRTGSFNVRLESAYESISLNSSKTASISSGGSMKYYTYTPSTTTQVQFYSTGSSDTYGYIFNTNLSPLASNDDGGSDHNFKITYTLSANTTYILGCRFYSSSKTGSFNVRLESAYESISLNSSKTASISSGGSMKYYTYTPSSTTKVLFYSTGSEDTYGYIFNTNMSPLASNDDGGSDHNFKITYTLSANTTYILGCRFYSSSRTGSFNIRLENAYESISLNAVKTAIINTGGDMKYYTYTPTSTTRVQFYSTGSDDTYGYIFNTNLGQLTSNDDGGSDRNFKITYTLSANTTYVLGCRFYDSSKTGSFTVKLDTGYESISLNASKTASINTCGDMKYYTITPACTAKVQFCSTGGFDTYGYIYDSSMDQLASNDDGGNGRNFKITYTLNANTTYILGCRFYSSSTIGSINVRLDAFQTGYTYVNINQSGTTQGFSITPTSNRRITVYSTGSYDTVGYLYDANMNLLVYNDDYSDDRNFCITYDLRANTTYYIRCKFYNSSTVGSFMVSFDLSPIVTDSVSLAQTDDIDTGSDRIDADVTDKMITADIEELGIVEEPALEAPSTDETTNANSAQDDEQEAVTESIGFYNE